MIVNNAIQQQLVTSYEKKNISGVQGDLVDFDQVFVKYFFWRKGGDFGSLGS